MSHPLFGMIDSTLQRIRDIVDVNSVVGDPITTPEALPFSRFAKSATVLAAVAPIFPPKLLPGRNILLAAAPGWEFG